VPLAAAVALAHGLERFGFAPTLKWPNDVRIGGRKVAGLLAAQSRGALVLSFGLNVNQIAFPEALAAISTSMALEADRAFDRGAVLAAVLDALEYMLTLVTTNADALRDFYQVILEWIGDEVEIRPHAGTHAIVGTFEDITTEGGLYLRHPDGRAETFYAGDVSLRPVSP
jgi:BirA family transcriptional regulator, biotin operon repressor / biotin---[acetyl-CoA-carboxylase] ligase